MLEVGSASHPMNLSVGEGSLEFNRLLPVYAQARHDLAPAYSVELVSMWTKGAMRDQGNSSRMPPVLSDTEYNQQPTAQKSRNEIFLEPFSSDQLASDKPSSGQLSSSQISSGQPSYSQSSHYQSLENDPVMEEDFETVFINNAGIVILAPYLPVLFDRLGLLKDQKFKSSASAERAMHLLQYMNNGNCQSAEFALVLNKKLTGIPMGFPVTQGIEITESEIEVVESLILHGISEWSAVGKTSIDGFRRSFFQRQGKLQYESDAWHLYVEGRPYDMLLDQLPWSIGTIKYSWMDELINVHWR